MATKTHGSIAAEAAAYLEGSGDVIPRSRGDSLEIRRQSTKLCEWAKNAGCLTEYAPPNGPRSRGAEHEVFFDEQTGRVFKRTLPGSFGSILTEVGLRRTATPYFYLRRMELLNQVFGSNLRLEYVTTGEQTSIVISQPWAYPADPNRPLPHETEIEDFMTSLGFKPVANAPHDWHREADGVRVSDARSDNFIKSHMGVIPIDLIISKTDKF